MATLENSCSACYKATAPECVESYLIGGLTPGTQYHVIATDSRGRKYEVDNDEPCDVDGNITLIFPEGLNSSAAGTFTIEVFDLGAVTSGSNAFCNPATLTACDGDFTCIELSFYKLGEGSGTLDSWQLLCLCPEDATCDGMCTVPENEFDFTEFIGIMGIPYEPGENGFYIVPDAKAFILYREGRYETIYTCCLGIIGYYLDTAGPYQFNEETEIWEPMVSYTPSGWDFGVSIGVSGSIPEFATAAFQVSTDSGATWGALQTGITSQELTDSIIVNTALTSFRSRLLVTLPDGCSYPSAVSTLTE